MSSVPMTGHHLNLNLNVVETYPEAYISMGQTAERVAEEFGVSRETQDEFALKILFSKIFSTLEFLTHNKTIS